MSVFEAKGKFLTFSIKTFVSKTKEQINLNK